MGGFLIPPYCPWHRWEIFGAVLPSSALRFSAPRRCWSTFIFRTTGLRAVEDFINQVLLTLVGLTLTSSDSWALLGIPHLWLHYNTDFLICQVFFWNFFKGPVDFILFLSLICPRAGAQPQALYILIIASFFRFVKNFFYFFQPAGRESGSLALLVLLGPLLVLQHGQPLGFMGFPVIRCHFVFSFPLMVLL